ncbi:hypothetical protein C8F04DRAFT_1255768, partial [Mycena alexandri]
MSSPGRTGTAPRRPAPAGKSVRKRTRQKASGTKRGKVLWIHGTKLVFFEKRGEEWKVANELGVVQLGRFYTKITNLYLLKYGHDMEDNEDLKDDVEDPTNPDAVLPGSENLNEEEAAAQSDSTAKIRKRIAAWYCRRYRGVEQSEKELFTDILGGVVSTGPGYPRKAQPIHLYSRKYYEERVKTRFEGAWAAEKRRAEALERDPEAEIKIRNAVTREVFDEETQEFKDKLAKAVEAEHLAAIRAWELTRADAPTKSAAEINAALKNAAFYLEPLAEAISAKFLMNCSILLCGPIGDRGGGIDVRSVHAGTSRSLTPQKWHQFDKMGYDATVKSFVRFSEHCFSKEECQSRVVDGDSSASATASTVLPPARRVDTPASAEGQHEPGRAGASSAGLAGGGNGADSAGANGAAAVGANGASAGASGAAAVGANGAPAGASGAGASASGAAANETGNGAGVNGDGVGGNDIDMGAAAGTNGAAANETGSRDQAGGGDAVVRPEHLPVWKPDEDVWAATWSAEVKKAFASFATYKAALGVPWAKLVDAWVKVEEASGFDNEGGKLTTEGRPKEVSDFISRGRHWIMVRKIDAPGSRDAGGSYAARWWTWWTAIEGKGELHTMHGRMGCMLVVLSLMWWGAGDGGAEWEAAVTAVTTTLEEVLESGRIEKKTAAPARKTAGKKKSGEKRRREEKENEGDKDEDEDIEEDEDGGGERTRAKRQRKSAEEPRCFAGAGAPDAVQRHVKLLIEQFNWSERPDATRGDTVPVDYTQLDADRFFSMNFDALERDEFFCLDPEDPFGLITVGIDESTVPTVYLDPLPTVRQRPGQLRYPPNDDGPSLSKINDAPSDTEVELEDEDGEVGTEGGDEGAVEADGAKAEGEGDVEMVDAGGEVLEEDGEEAP